MKKPFWCENRVTFEGCPAKLSELMESVSGDEALMDFGHTWNGHPIDGQILTFTKIVELPPEEDSEEDRIRLWGTAFDATEVAAFRHFGYLIYRFETADGPPVPVCRALRKQFPDLFLTWFFHEPKRLLAGYIKNEEEIQGKIDAIY